MVATTDTPRRRPGRRSVKKDGPNPVDVHVGSRIRLRRMLLGMSQTELGHALDLTFQQVQKYERGDNRVSASMLHKTSQVLDIPVSFFFEDLDPNTLNGTTEAAPPPKRGRPRKQVEAEALMVGGESETIFRRETLEFVRYYSQLPTEVRQRLLDVVKSASKLSDDTNTPTLDSALAS
jgi:transcriptional regulator with XRE-family HTH domain